REIYEIEIISIAKVFGMTPEQLTKEIYNLYQSGVLEKFSDNTRQGRGKPHISPDAKSIKNLSKTLYGKELCKFSSQKMVALLGEGREDGKLHIDKTAEALVIAPFSVRRKKSVYAVKAHPKSVKNLLPEHAVYFIRSDCDVHEGDLAIVYENHFDKHDKHDAELVSVEKTGNDLVGISHTSGNKYMIKDLKKGRIHRIVFIALDQAE
ncbi:MAG: hypothetical protein ACTSXV_01435, partial [Alphaproteobacteria bacterium]